ncbi:MAG TPA: PKD domain-containing protein, partial [Chitinophagales bacterium]|nr:PKD domain-containing protein [Chitinophagales bacterium]
APDNTIAVNLPPTAAITATPTTGQVPLAVTFSGTNSTDPENSPLTYQWNLGDGTTATTSTVSHTYSDILGSINVSLTVTDNMGLQHTAYQTITLLDENNTFPCQTSFTVSNMPTCANNNGRISINAANGTTFQLRNANNTLLTPTNGNQYNNLSAGIYQFTANSNTTACTDTFQLHLSIDSTTCAGWQPSSCAMDIGTNMSGFADWGVERPMRNLFKHVRPEPIPFTTTCFCWYVPNILGEMTFDANGYPTHIPQTTSAGNNTVVRYVISSESETGTNLQMNQQYVLLYDGSGTMQVGGGVNVSSNTAGRIQFTLTANNNIFVEILSSAPNNHIRNIRLLRLADENINLTTNPFYQGFIDKIAPFKMLRF